MLRSGEILTEICEKFYKKQKIFWKVWVYNWNLSDSQVKFYQNLHQIFEKIFEKIVEISEKLSEMNVANILRKFLGNFG